MASITITINDANIVDIRDALCQRWGYLGADNNVDKVAFLKAFIAKYIKDEYRFAKVGQAIVADIETIRNNADVIASSADIT